MSHLDDELFDASFAEKSILVVDDAQAMIHMIGDLVRCFGFGDIKSANEGTEAFELIRRNTVDVIVCDYLMNGMDGIALAKLVRTSSSSPRPDTPIVMMTGHADRATLFAARDAGINEFIVKPFASVDLFKKLAAVIDNPRKFVSVDDFVGPDRRRRLGDGFDGDDRRKTGSA